MKGKYKNQKRAIERLAADSTLIQAYECLFGCIKKGFDFLGIHFGESSSISKTSLEIHRLKLAQRYARNESPALIGAYIKRWLSWYAGSFSCCNICSNHQMTSIKPNASRPLGILETTKENDCENQRSC